ncbi:MAG TPA: hypothetical protein VFE03_04210 [Caulobacteraceae bacterium]|jgi:hypothetical protein|nr:hypothetical protein [Caulobacteraceae bacterium]
MPPRTPDRALRRIVAELATLEESDREAVLEDLDHGRRRAIRALLDEYAGEPAAAAMVDKARPSIPEGLSPWLAIRIDAPTVERGGGQGEHAGLEPAFEFEMSPTALKALRASAAEACRPASWAGTTPQSDWFARTLTLFLGRGVAL